MSQKAEILTYLREGHSITTLLALAKFRCNCLAERIRDLRRDGWDITTEKFLTPVTRKKVARYSLTDPAQKEPTGIPQPGRKAKPATSAIIAQVERELEHTRAGDAWKEGARWALEEIKKRQ
jgi:hypothetical protein